MLMSFIEALSVLLALLTFDDIDMSFLEELIHCRINFALKSSH